ncbi:MarR family winged helix-turn-helix transcriptional regulator [Actinopolymorpha alba]|uniref:MarR family winged helix-turn-helix transcriptional regulator n=1 Tax=Actinopolymorpha alba TaxID=533267 RepID=UPI000367DBF1|nr:MarR family transcriptional regulator [Actinopolymorpha alba]
MSEPKASRPRDEFPTVFWATKRAMAEAADVAYRRHGVRDGQQFLLMCLWQDDGLAPGELARRLGLATPTVTRAAIRMEAAGLVTREPDPHDRRLVRIRLTKRGRELETILDEEMRTLSDRALATLSESQRRELIEALEQIRRNLSR